MYVCDEQIVLLSVVYDPKFLQLSVSPSKTDPFAFLQMCRHMSIALNFLNNGKRHRQYGG